MALKLNTIHCKDALSGLKKLPAESIDCVMTSPPYWSMRDYGIPPTKWSDGTSCVLGLESTFIKYIEHLCEVFDEIRCVLKPSGSLWVNLGDTYSGSWGNYAPNGKTARKRIIQNNRDGWIKQGIQDPSFKPPSSGKQVVPRKSLCLIPERFAVAMCQRGWTLRNRIVWHKTNHMPASVKDRFTNSWEYLLFFVKEKRYFFDLDAVREPHKCLANTNIVLTKDKNSRKSPHIRGRRQPPRQGEPGGLHPNGKNPTDYWSMSPETRSQGAILGEKDVVKVPGGKGWTGHPTGGGARIVKEQDPRWLPPNGKNPGDVISLSPQKGRMQRSWTSTPGSTPGSTSGYNKTHHRKYKPGTPGSNIDFWSVATQSIKRGHFAVYPEQLCERPIKAGCPVDGIVLDPFIGSGTTAVVAKKLGRKYIGYEVNPDYVAMAKTRLKNTPVDTQLIPLKGGSKG